MGLCAACVWRCFRYFRAISYPLAFLGKPDDRNDGRIDQCEDGLSYCITIPFMPLNFDALVVVAAVLLCSGALQDAERTIDKLTGEEHTAYLIDCRCTAPDMTVHRYTVLRRYSEFVALHAAIKFRVPSCRLDPLPPKRANCLPIEFPAQMN